MNGVPPRLRSAAPLVGLVAAIAWAHTILRGDRWAYEWTWGLFQYQLVVVLIAPVVAGAAAWEAVALRRASEAVRAAGRSTAFAGAVATRILASIAIGLALGVVPVVAAIWRAQGVGLPALEAALTIVPAAAQVVAVVVSSFALAERWPRPIVVPILAVGWFGALIAANVSLPERIARTGGATASLLGLHVPPATRALQVAVALLVAGAALGLVWSRSVRPASPALRWAAVAGPLVALVGIVALQPSGRPLFERRPVEVTCWGARPAWCVAPSYAGAVPVLRARTSPTLREVRAVGALPPARIVQGGAGRTTIEDVLNGPRALVPLAVVYAWLPDACSVGATSPLLDDLSGWASYLEDRLAGRHPVATGEAAAALDAAALRIARCEGA